MNVALLFLYGFSLFGAIECYKILGVFPTQWKSHWNLGSSILRQLAAAGHDITYISPFELNEVNVKNVILTDYPEDHFDNKFDLEDLSTIMNFVLLPQMFESLINFTLSHQNVQSLMKSDAKFDVVIAEIFNSEALFGLGPHFNCPVIAVTTFGMSMYANVASGIAQPTSFVPHIFLPYTEKMNFWERAQNTFMWKIDELILHFHHYPKQQKLYEKFFPEVKVPFEVQRKHVALLFNNNYFASSTIKPQMPNTIDIGGIHIDQVKPLPQNIQDYLDSAKNGAILFSMGSMLKAVYWPVEKREAFVKAFSKLNVKVLWKYENDTLPNKPDNVMISPWVPQRDILAHPNIKLFITHGGLLGTTEALVEGVPVLGIPIYGDQRMNMNIAVNRGYAMTINFEDINENLLVDTIHSILKNASITLKAIEVSRVYNDRPMTPQKSIVYWTEYVIRHKGAPLLQSAGQDLSYFEFNSFDVYVVAMIMLVSALVLIYALLTFLSGKIFGSRDHQMKLKIK